MSDALSELRSGEFGRLDATGHAYLDYTGSGLYGESQIIRHAELLRRQVLGNPHSDTPTSRSATRRVEAAREQVLSFFSADPDEWDVVFTANATGALKLVGESFPFGPGSRLLLTTDNHNSVNGIRSFAAHRGAEVEYIPLDHQLRSPPLQPHLSARPVGPSLFAYPAQSNFSGVKHPLGWIEEAHGRDYHVLLDAAAFVGTSRLDLSEIAPDFVAVSFYKMFGYPTGIGALIARREALARLERPWFAGGTVEFVSVLARLHRLREGSSGFEDGTVDFLSIAAVPFGLELLRRVGMEAVNAHVMGLTARLLARLTALRHSNRTPLVVLYGPVDTVARGGTIAFNVVDPAGSVLDYQVVESAAGERRVSLRGGCFCNPGAGEAAFGYDAESARRCFGAQPTGPLDRAALSHCMGGRPAGAVRASLGIASNEADIDRLVDVLLSFKDVPASSATPNLAP